MGSYHVGQAGLLTSGDPPALASQSAGITGVSHNAQPEIKLLIDIIVSNSLFFKLWNIIDIVYNVTNYYKASTPVIHHPSQETFQGRPGAVAHTCTPSTLGGRGGLITWDQEFDTSPVSTKNTKKLTGRSGARM